MKFAALSLFALCALMMTGMADTPAPVPALEPNANFTLQFPELPPTFYVAKGGEKIPAQLSVRLPSNYTKDGKFPIFVFLEGGDGGTADKNSPGGATAMMGGKDYIFVGMPLFKKAYDPKGHETFPISDEMAEIFPPQLLQMAKNFPVSGVIMPGDYETISTSYATMLKKLNEVVPNIDPSRSTLAGFSNGGHTIGVLLAKADPGTLQQFHSFAMLEGGMSFAMGYSGATPLPDALKNHRYFMMLSDTTTPTDLQAMAPLRTFEYNLCQKFCEKEKTAGFDFTFYTTRAGHHFGAEQKPTVAEWMRQDLVKVAAPAK